MLLFRHRAGLESQRTNVLDLEFVNPAFSRHMRRIEGLANSSKSVKRKKRGQSNEIGGTSSTMQ
jgi:hypothetical protein